MDIKHTAKELYFSNVANDNFRNNFLNQLETHLVVDKRSEGYYCCYCGKIDKKEVAFAKNDYVVFPRKANNEVWIVNEHYDGCRGWD